MAKKSIWAKVPFIIHLQEEYARQILVAGRDRWALECLIAAGERGCTPIDTPGPRWSGYVHNLRRLGVPVETVTEAHDGPFSGTHARYVLKARVTRAERLDA